MLVEKHKIFFMSVQNPLLNTSNPAHLTYTKGMLDIAVLGGIRLEGLDRLRVTLKIKITEDQRPALRHNLDLYNDTQVEKLIRRVAEKLEVGTSVIGAALAELTDELEHYRLREIERQATALEQPKKLLTTEKINQAKIYASAPNLLQHIGEDLQETGIVGEWTNALIEYVVMSSRKCVDPLSVITLAKSGMGKSYLQEKVASTMPSEDIIESTQITESSFYRFGREELRGKIFLIEDLDGAEAVLYPIREMQSKKRISKTVTVKDAQGKLKTVTLVVEGPVSVCGCTTKEAIYEDNANRSLLLYLDNSKEQDEQVMDYHRKIKAGLIDQEEEEQARERLEHLQRILQPVKVINPYAIHITLPQEVFKPRRTLPLLLSFIEAITFCHQYQREEKSDTHGEAYIETTLEDIEWGFKLLREVLFRKSDELTGACREFYEWLKIWAIKHKIEKFFARDLRTVRRIHPRTLNRYLEELASYGMVEVIGGKKQRLGYEYTFTGLQVNLRDRVDEQLQRVIEKIKAAAKQGTKTRRASA